MLNGGRPMNKRKAIAAILLAALALTGCKDKKTTNNEVQSETQTSQTTQTQVQKQDINVWVPQEVTALTKEKLDEWIASTKWSSRYEFIVTAVSEGEAAGKMKKDPASGADIYSFTQDQLEGLAAADALDAPDDDRAKSITSQNDSGAVLAATYEDKVYAYPETSENSYILYYDKSVVSDPSSIEGILADCEAADKYLYMDLESGWYNVSFFFGTGAQCRYIYGSDGKVSDSVCDYDSDMGLSAMKAMIDLKNSSGFAQSTGSDAAGFDPDGGKAGAVISGTWDSDVASGLLGNSYGAAELPTFTVDGNTYKMSGFLSSRMIGVAPQEDSDRLSVCHAAAEFLAGDQMQSLRFEQNGYTPSNLAVQNSELIQTDPLYSALAAQAAKCRPQRQYPNAYWDISKSFGTDIVEGRYDGASDDELREALSEYVRQIKEAE